MSIKWKLILITTTLITVVILLVAAIIGNISYQQSSESIQKIAEQQLVATRELTKSKITSYINTIEKQIQSFSNDLMVIDAMKGFKASFSEFKNNKDLNKDEIKNSLNTYYQQTFGAKYQTLNPNAQFDPLSLLNDLDADSLALQYALISNNDNAIGEKDLMTAIPFASSYTNLHKKYHPHIRDLLVKFEYYDIFLVDIDSGDIIYSVFKELDYTTSLYTGPYKNSGIAQAFKGVVNSADPDSIFLTSFDAYTPSYEAPAAFIASPIFDQGKRIGVLIFQMPIDKFNNILTHDNAWQQNGLGLSGETYLVGTARTMQSMSRFLIEDKARYLEALTQAGIEKNIINQIKQKETSIGLQPIDSIGVNKALSGETGIDSFSDYRNIDVLSAYTQIKFGQEQMALLSEIDRDEAFSSLPVLRQKILIAALIISLLAVLLSIVVVYFFANLLSKRLIVTVDIANEVAKGKVYDIGEINSEDEIGELMSAMKVMQINLTRRQAEDKKEKSRVERIKQALDVAGTSVLVVNESNHIQYINDSMKALLQLRENNFAQEITDFKAELIAVGGSFDLFYADPKKQKDTLAQLRDTTNSLFELADITLDQTLTPLFDENNQRLGTVIEWIDISQRLAAEKQEQEIASENSRIRQALDVCNTSVMIANNNNNIIYTNTAVVNMLSARQTSIKTVHPEFDTRQLMGRQVDLFGQLTHTQDNLLETLTTTHATSIIIEELTFKITATPIFDQKNQRLGTVVEWFDVTDKLAEETYLAELAATNNRIKQALDVCNTSVMIANDNMEIIYTNTSVINMLSSRENTIKKSLPLFNATDLMGKSVDVFHKVASHQRNLIAGLTHTYTSNIKIEDLTFNLSATPIFNEDKKRLGTVIEWADLTERLAEDKRLSDLAIVNNRIKQALDVCNTSVMIANDNLEIIYTNESVISMLSDREAIIRQSLPDFSVKSLLGTNVDIFHKVPTHQRNLLESLNNTHTTSIKLQHLTFKLSASPIFSSNNVRLGTVIEWFDLTDELLIAENAAAEAAANARIKQALDNVSSNVMVADNNRNIIYMNNAVQTMMLQAEEQLRSALPELDANNLVGQKIDVFHKNPEHQATLLEGLTRAYETEINIAGLTFDLIANPVLDQQGNRLGSVLQWNNRTKEVAIEQEIDQLINAAGQGDLSQRINLKGKEGFFNTLGQGLNKLVGIADEVVNDTVVVLDALAHGDLSKTIDKNYDGSFGKLRRDANATVDKLTEIINNIRSSANTVTLGAEEISSGILDLSQRTEEQASSLEETAASMEEMTSSVRQSAQSANHVNQLAQNAKNSAIEGGQVVSSAITAMANISDSSNKISDIISVIDEIAFQTNLLALNAAVEAARAGEQGRGFAVVAGEVRTLAQRSATAAKEIKELIRDSVDKVNIGTELVNQSGNTLTDIVASFDKVTSMISEISNSSEEQASGIEQVNNAITEMDKTTQQNGALVEQTTAAASNMNDQARSMMTLLRFFSAETKMSQHLLENTSESCKDFKAG